MRTSCITSFRCQFDQNMDQRNFLNIGIQAADEIGHPEAYHALQRILEVCKPSYSWMKG